MITCFVALQSVMVLNLRDKTTSLSSSLQQEVRDLQIYSNDLATQYTILVSFSARMHS